MREYQPRTVQELAACTCDRCKRRMTPEDGEWHERLAFDHTCGFDSIFGDGNTVSLDLCQHCAREVLGQWVRVSPPADTDVFGLWKDKKIESAWDTPPLAEALMSMPNVGEDADFERSQDVRGKAARRLTTLKGSIRKPAKPVSIQDMNTAIAETAGHPKHVKPSGKRKPKKQP